MKKRPKWLAPVAFLVLALATVYVVSQQSASFSAEGFIDYVKQVRPWGLAVSAACMIGFILFEGMALLVLCGALGYRRKWRHGVLYSAADIYFSAITPSATGGQPASALMMISDGIPGAVTTVVLLLNLAMYNVALFGTALFAFALWPRVLSAFDTPAHILIAVGTVLHLVLIAGILLLVLSEKLFLRMTDLFLHIGQKLHLVKNAEGRREKLLKIERDYRASAGVLSRHKGALLRALLLNFAQRVAATVVPAVLYAALGGPLGDLRKLFAIQVMAVIGSNSVPIPGAVGVADYLFLNGYSTLLEDPINLELLTRTVSFYGCVLVCALLLLVSYILHKRQGSR